jgi:two-component system CheB/CheR fusion protein
VADEQGQDLAALVVVGASAGGIDALSDLLGPIPAGFPAPIVIAQHTLATRASHLAEILAGRTRLSVVTVDKKAELSAGTVYVVPAGHHIMVTDHVVEARAAGGGTGRPRRSTASSRPRQSSSTNG